MNRVSFRRFLRERKIPEDQIEQFSSIAERFEGSLKGASRTASHKSPTTDDILAFSATLIGQKLNTFDNYWALALYFRFLKNNRACAAVLELIDGAEAMENLHQRLGEAVGEQRRDEIFRGIELPPIGTPNSQRPRITQAVMERLENMVEPGIYKKILANCLRTLDDGSFIEERKKYLECKGIDEFLERKGREFIALLEQIKQEKRLFFTQEITDEVIEFVQSHPEIRQGVRERHILYEVKIPHMAKEYLAESDEKMKRYYYCHCPWVKESLRTGDARISPAFCLCSAGFHKKYWEGVLGQPLEAEIVESVLQGDSWCKIAIHLPPHLAEDTGREAADRI